MNKIYIFEDFDLKVKTITGFPKSLEIIFYNTCITSLYDL